jgi:hypothetical protein
VDIRLAGSVCSVDLMDLVGCCLLRRGTICEFLLSRELTGYHSKLAIAPKGSALANRALLLS